MRSGLVLLLLAPTLAADQRDNLAAFARGLYAERTGDHDTARQQLETVLEADPGSYYLARRTARLQDPATASGTLRRYARTHPDHLPSQLYYADYLEQTAPRDAAARATAIEMLEAANERFPHTADVFSRLINLYENAERTDESRALFRAQFEAPKAGPYHWMSLAPIARTLLPGDSPELAEKLDLIALKTAETGIAIPEAARTVSDYYRSTGRIDEAIATLRKHVGAVPQSLELRTRLGMLLLYAGRDEEAEASLLETLSIDPKQVMAHKVLGQFYADRGDTARSLHHRAEVLKIGGGDPDAFLQLADEYLEAGQPHPARLLLEKARFDHPEHAGIAARLAVATLRDGDTAGAADLFRQAEALAKDSGDPDDLRFLGPDFQMEFAGSLRDAGDLEAAEARLRSAAKNTPADRPKDQARAFRELARLWLDQDKNHGPAASLLQRALSLDPGNAETKALLERARTNR